MPLDVGNKETGWISEWAFQKGALSADSIGRQAVADGFITPQMMANMISRSATITVALSDATIIEKLQADFQCSGTNDTTQMAAAIAALPVAGGKISLSSGHLIIKAAGIRFIDPVKNVWIDGQGKEATILRADDASNSTMIAKSVPAKWEFVRFKLSNLTLDGNKTNNTTSQGIDGTGMCSGLTLDNVMIKNFNLEGIDADATNGANKTGSWFIYNTQVWFCGSATAYGVKLVLVGGLITNGFDVSYNIGTGIRLEGCFESTLAATQVDQNATGLSLFGGSRITFLGGYFAGGDFNMMCYSANRLNLIGVQLSSCTNASCYFASGSAISITGCTIDNPVAPGGMTVGIRVTDTTSDITIIGNNFSDYQAQYRCLLEGTGTGRVVQHNTGVADV